MDGCINAGKYINKISNRLRRPERTWEQMGLTKAQGNILAYILMEGTESKIYQKDVEREFDLRPSTATELLRALEKKEWIRRVNDERDGRYKILKVTEKAETIREDLQAEIYALEAVLTKGISNQELKQFKKTIEKMLKNLEN